MTKIIYTKPTISIISRVNALPLKSGTRQGLLFNIVQEVLATVIRQGKERKVMQKKKKKKEKKKPTSFKGKRIVVT